MKHLLLLLMLFFLGGCAVSTYFYASNGPRLNPKPNASQIIMTEEDLDTPYNVIGRIESVGNPPSSFEMVLDRMRDKAAEAGADAVVRIRRTWRLNPYGYRAPVAVGVAVAFKGRTNLLEEDLRVGLSVDAVKSIFGLPYHKAGVVMEIGDTELQRYVSWKSRKAYEITFYKGRVWKISWSDVSYDIEQANKKLRASISPGAKEEDVRNTLGPPQRVTVAGSWGIWWYEFEFDKENIFGAFFKDGVLLGIKAFRKGEVTPI